MSDDVSARLAAVRTEYAPHGWSDTTSGGFEIVFACDDEFGGVAGIVKNHGMHAVTWDGDGVIEDDEADDCSNWNLVPLPAPVQCPPVQKLATSGPSITRPVPAVDAWVAQCEDDDWWKLRVTAIETVNGKTRIICGPVSLNASDDLLTGPTDRGPWRPIGEVK